MTDIDLAFGKGIIRLTLQDGPRYEVIRAQFGRPLINITDSIQSALDHPIGYVSLTELAQGKRTAAIAVCDITRPAPNAITLPPLIERLHRAGIGSENVTIVIATGLHRAATVEELRAILGFEIASRYRVVNHDAKNFAAHRSLGSTRRGTPVYVDETFMATDLHMTLGLIEPHLMLGFSGGRKLIAPGVAAQETIKVIHSPGFMRERMAIEGSISENPLHDELLEIARLARHDFMLDVTLTPEREISGIFAGEPVQAHAAGVQWLRETSTVTLDQPVDAVITSSAGYPLDLTFYQAIKAITAAQHVLVPGGKILMLAECSEGAGSPEFAKQLRNYAGPRQYLDAIDGAPVQVDQWQLERLAMVERRHPLLFFTPGLSPTEMGTLGACCYYSPSAALSALYQGLPDNSIVAVIPDGPYTYARVPGLG